MINTVRKTFDNILGLLFPPFCVHCEKLLNYRETVPLCPECRELWEEEKHSICKDCFKKVEECECVPPRAKSKIKKSFHLCEYDPTVKSVTASLVLCCKDHNYKFVNKFVADELEATVRAHLKSFKNTVITYVPRSREKVIKTGVDQSLICARELAKRFDIECVGAIKRVGGTEQKSLDFVERLENARFSYRARNDALLTINSRNVILYDDIVTTGASLCACADILKSMGARTIYALCLGRVYRKGKGNGQSDV